MKAKQALKLIEDYADLIRYVTSYADRYDLAIWIESIGMEYKDLHERATRKELAQLRKRIEPR